jgi:acetyl esterase/lipase
MSIAAACLLWTGAAQAATATTNLSYDIDSPAAAPANLLDLYAPDGAAPADRRPVVVYVHGGGWRRGDKDNKIENKVDLFTGHGYLFASVNYRLSPLVGDPANPDPARIKFPDHPHDVGEAIGWLDRHVGEYGGDSSRMIVIGHSAGAQIAALVATNPSYVEAYGVEPWQLIGAVSLDTDAFDLTAEATQTRNTANRDLIWNAFGTPAENAATGSWAAGSPILWASAPDPELLLVTSANPSRLADNQSMARALDQDPAGVFVAPYDHEGINEQLGSPADTSGETRAVNEFVSRMVFEAVDPKAKLKRQPKRRIHTEARRAKVRFGFSSPTPGAGFECRLDNPRLKPCKSWRKLRVKRGRHTFRVRAVSERGRPGPTKRFRFRVLPQ